MRSWLRRIGRGRIASAIPDSMSLAMLGAATRVEPRASTPLNMKAIKMVSCDAASRTSAAETFYRVGQPRGAAPASGPPLASILGVTEFAQPGPAVGWQAGHPDSNRAVLSEDLRHRAGGDHPAVIDHREPVADLLDLAEQM